MSDTHSCDALIVGGGMVGLSLAVAAASAGLSVCVIDNQAPEQALDAGFDGRVSAIAAGSARLLQSIGVWEAIEPDAQPILDIRVSDGDAPWFLHYDHTAVRRRTARAHRGESDSARGIARPCARNVL